MAGPGVAQGGNFFSLSGITDDWDTQRIFGMSHNNPIKIKSIELRGGTGGKGAGTTDRVVIKEEDENGPRITTLATPNPEKIDRVPFKEDGQYMRPFIDFSEGIFNTGHLLIFELA